jgi:hypothetical protein
VTITEDDRIRWELEHDFERARSVLILHNAKVTPDPKPGSYTNRTIVGLVVKSRSASSDATSSWYTITGSDGWTAGCSKEVYDQLPEGTEYVFEKRGFNEISGWFISGRWYDHKSDEDFTLAEAERASSAREHDEKMLEAHHVEWSRREDALPDWLRSRLQTFHDKGGDSVRRHGWDYELVVARLAALYADAPRDEEGKFIDTPEITRIEREEGTSGNQHNFAKMLANFYLQDPSFDFSATPSALTPITGDPFFEKQAADGSV